MRAKTLATVAALAGFAAAQSARPEPTPFPSSCSGVSAARFAFTLAENWSMTKLIGGLSQPRTIVFDSLGQMLVLQASTGISVHTFGSDGCVSSSTSLIQNRGLNHGLALSPDGKTLYASSATTVWSWDYDASSKRISNQKTIVRGMSNGGHVTRTVQVVPNAPNLIIVSVGSNSNWDYPSGNPAVGRSCVKVFDVSKAPSNGYNYPSEGQMLAYGLRNEIGLTFDPNGMVWGVENSGDDFRRTVNGQATDIHIDNPAEELNMLGDPKNPKGTWYGYPTCFTAWDGSVIRGTTLKTGDQFVVTPNSSYTDSSCVGKSTPPRLSFPAHSAPIDAAFDRIAANLYVTFHGSWNRQPATGYKLIEIPFTNMSTPGVYEPVAPSDSKTGFRDVVAARDPGSCASQTLTRSSCWRPSAVKWDPAGTRLFMASDNQAEGEIFVLRKNR